MSKMLFPKMAVSNIRKNKKNKRKNEEMRRMRKNEGASRVRQILL